MFHTYKHINILELVYLKTFARNQTLKLDKKYFRKSTLRISKIKITQCSIRLYVCIYIFNILNNLYYFCITISDIRKYEVRCLYDGIYDYET